VRAQLDRFADAGVDLVLLQMSPQLEEMERFSELVLHGAAGLQTGRVLTSV
jgi:FMNH2-dependent dimethyl sulfone monooxygenase